MSAATASFTAGQRGSFTITTAASGKETITESGALPGGMMFVVGSNGTATLHGTPKSKGQFTITIGVSDGVLPEGVQTLVVMVG